MDNNGGNDGGGISNWVIEKIINGIINKLKMVIVSSKRVGRKLISISLGKKVGFVLVGVGSVAVSSEWRDWSEIVTKAFFDSPERVIIGGKVIKEEIPAFLLFII